MRRLTAALSAALLALSLAACGGGEKSAPAKACDAWITAANAFTAGPSQATNNAEGTALAYAIDHSSGDLRKALLTVQQAEQQGITTDTQDAYVAAVGVAVTKCHDAGSTVDLT